MAFSFSRRYNTTRLFDIDTSDFDYISLEELFKRDGSDFDSEYQIRGVYINSKGKFDDAPVVALDDCYVNLPSHLTGACRAMLEDPQAIKAINEGKAGFKIRSYTQKRYNKVCYTVEWVDLTY